MLSDATANCTTRAMVSVGFLGFVGCQLYHVFSDRPFAAQV